MALEEANSPGLTPVQLQKILFVLGERRKKKLGPEYYSFQPYHYGPFDPRIYADAELLEAEGLISIDSPMGRSLRRYSITPAGTAYVATFRDRTDGPTRDLLKRIVGWAQRLSFTDLVRSVYSEFPGMRVNSVFREPA